MARLPRLSVQRRTTKPGLTPRRWTRTTQDPTVRGLQTTLGDMIDCLTWGLTPMRARVVCRGRHRRGTVGSSSRRRQRGVHLEGFMGVSGRQMRCPRGTARGACDGSCGGARGRTLAGADLHVRVTRLRRTHRGAAFHRVPSRRAAEAAARPGNAMGSRSELTMLAFLRPTKRRSRC